MELKKGAWFEKRCVGGEGKEGKRIYFNEALEQF